MSSCDASCCMSCPADEVFRRKCERAGRKRGHDGDELHLGADPSGTTERGAARRGLGLTSVAGLGFDEGVRARLVVMLHGFGFRQVADMAEDLPRGGHLVSAVV